jgi:YhgE/Pip-like protein
VTADEERDPEPPALSPAGVRAALDAPGVWAPPMILVALLVSAMTLVYLGSIVDPAGHLEDLPVAVVNQDAGSAGQQIAAGLTSAPAVTDRLRIETTDLAGARRRMDHGKVYATVLIPPGFTRSLRGIASGRGAGASPRCGRSGC